MATIDEMSINYASSFMKQVDKLNAEQLKWLRKHPDEPHPTGGIKACFIFQRNAYLEGANFVLDEIEKALFANIRYKDNFMDVRAKIKELRGK